MRFKTRLGVVLAALGCATGASAQGNPVDVVEYYHSGFDHYFISALPADIAALDSGTLKGWARTGLSFKSYDAPASGTSPVCRFYIPPAQGDSHFYSASPAECAEVAAKFPAFSYESPSVMHVGLPDAATGACGGGWTPVYRLWNNRADSNHRYTTDKGVRADMLARGYVAEGYGPEGVAMCAPASGPSLAVSTTSPSVLLMPGDSREVYVVVRPLDGFAGVATLAIDGLPPGVTAQFETVTVDVPADGIGVRIRFAATATIAPGDATVTVVAQAAGIRATSPLAVAVAPAGDPIAVRLRAEADADQHFMDLAAQGLALDDVLQRTAAYMAGHPDYARSGFSREFGTAWGRLKDGTLNLYIANRTGGEAAPPATVAPPLPKAAELPAAPKARLMHAFGDYFEPQQAVNDMRRFLAGRGWTVAQGGDGDADVRTIAKAKGDGFFYINAHGGAHFDDPTNPASSVKQYVLVTSTPVEDAAERDFAAMMGVHKDERIVHARAPNGYFRQSSTGVRVPQMQAYYGITRAFVGAYMSFSQDSVVFINACFSARDTDFINAFTEAGAGVYLGWDNAVYTSSAFRSPPYFVDRMVGANQFSMKESPPQRPFPYDLVLADMDRKGLKRDPTSGANLVAFTGKSLTAPPIFAPSIQYVAVDEWKKELTLTGYFGSRVGKVTVDGVELSVAAEDWTQTRIIARNLPVAGAGAKGDIVVTVEGVRSNARQLSQWTIPLNYEWTNVGDKKGLRFAGSGQVRFRADVGGYRLEPAEKPRYKLRGGVANPETKLEVVASGVHVEDSGCTLTASGTDVYYSPARTGAGLGPMLESFIRIDTEQLRGSLGLAFASIADPGTRFTTGGTYKVDGKPCPKYSTGVPPAFGLLDDVTLFPIDQSDYPEFLPWPSIDFTFAKGFPIGAVVRHGSKEEGNITVSWPAVTPDAPPRDTPDAGK